MAESSGGNFPLHSSPIPESSPREPPSRKRKHEMNLDVKMPHDETQTYSKIPHATFCCITVQISMLQLTRKMVMVVDAAHVH